MFKVNQANWERIVRAVLGIILLYVGFGGVVTGTLGTVLGIVGVLALITGLVGYCPLYSLIKFSTK
ncbi:MAG: DUF2892 domain-containing protein [Anaerolineales bacterium]|jgi:hypothetical protein|nr:DUF2892 domain-containing protein [Anaerolineales bacterium]